MSVRHLSTFYSNRYLSYSFHLILFKLVTVILGGQSSHRVFSEFCNLHFFYFSTNYHHFINCIAGGDCFMCGAKYGAVPNVLYWLFGGPHVNTACSIISLKLLYIYNLATESLRWAFSSVDFYRLRVLLICTTNV